MLKGCSLENLVRLVVDLASQARKQPSLCRSMTERHWSTEHFRGVVERSSHLHAIRCASAH